MAYQQNRNKTLTMSGEVGRLREEEKFYKGGMTLPFTVIDPFHHMGIKCHHPKRKGYSYFKPTRLFAIDLRYAPITFVNREMAQTRILKQQTGILNHK